MARLRATASAARSVLDGRQHDGMLDRVGAMTRHTNEPSKSGHARPSKSAITLSLAGHLVIGPGGYAFFLALRLLEGCRSLIVQFR